MKLKKIAWLMVFLGASVNAAEPIGQVSESVAMVQYMANQEALSLAPVRNQDDLNRVLEKMSPIDYLSPTAKEIFLNSLVFGSNGLASFNFTVLNDELDRDQSYQLLALFGMQRLIRNIESNKAKMSGAVELALPNEIRLNNMPPYIANDHMGYYCKTRGTCSRYPDDICTSNC